MLEALGGEIRRIRTDRGLSQESFADSIEMHRAQYSKIERGERNMTILTLKRIAGGLGSTLAELMARSKL